MEDQWKKIIAERACDIIDADDLDVGSKDLLNPEMRPETYIRELCSAGMWSDAVKVMARALPPREAVWWACVCARRIDFLADDADEIAALKAAEQWVYKPTSQNQADAFRLAQESDSRSAGMLAALAAAGSEGKLPLIDGQYTDLESSVFPQLLYAVVMISAATNGAEQINEQLRQMLSSGEDIARGGNGLVKDQQG